MLLVGTETKPNKGVKYAHFVYQIAFLLHKKSTVYTVRYVSFGTDEGTE